MATSSEQVSDRGMRQRGVPECMPLLAVAQKDLFSKNAFRITGLAVDATTREASRHLDELKMHLELGKSSPKYNGAYPLEPPPNLDEIREAIQKLKDPEKRIIDEFFWFWPESFGDSKSDPALQALAKGDTKTANDIWKIKTKDESAGIVAKHNLAVAFLMVSLEMEYSAIARKVPEDRRQKITESWKSSIRKWNRIAEDDKLWEKVAERIRQLNEANLPTGFARRMRTSFPEAFQTINAELILGIAQSGNTDLAKQYIQYLREHSQKREALDNSADRVLLTAKKRLQELIRQAVDRAEKSPRDAANAARDLLKQSQPTLDLFDIFYGDDSDERNELFDEVATVCNRLPVAYHKATGDNVTCLEILRLLLPFVTSAELKKEIQENIEILNKNVEAEKDQEIFKDLKPIKSAPELRTINGCGTTLYGSSDVDQRTGSFLTTYYFVLLMIPIFPICRYRVTRSGNSYRFFGRAPLRTFDKWHIVVVIGFIITMVIVCSSNQSGSTNSQSSYTPPASTADIPSPASSQTAPTYTPPSASSDGNVYRVPDYVSGELDREKAEIEADRTVLKQQQDQLDALGQKIDEDRISLDQTSQYAVDAFNAEVDQYNTLAQQVKEATAAFNVKVDNYNSKLQSYGR